MKNIFIFVLSIICFNVYAEELPSEIFNVRAIVELHEKTDTEERIQTRFMVSKKDYSELGNSVEDIYTRSTLHAKSSSKDGINKFEFYEESVIVLYKDKYTLNFTVVTHHIKESHKL